MEILGERTAGFSASSWKSDAVIGLESGKQ